MNCDCYWCIHGECTAPPRNCKLADMERGLYDAEEKEYWRKLKDDMLKEQEEAYYKEAEEYYKRHGYD